MSEEEKKAIDIIKDYKFDFECEGKYPYLRESITTLLNLIEKQQQEIEELKNTETYKIAIIDKDNSISKDKIKEKNEKLKTLLYQIRNELRWKVIIQEDGIYKPCKNLTKQEVYESYVKLNLMLKANYVFKNNEEAIEELLKEGE